MLEVLFMLIAAAIIPKASDVAMAGGGMDAAERAQFELTAAPLLRVRLRLRLWRRLRCRPRPRRRQPLDPEGAKPAAAGVRPRSPFSAIDVHGGGEDAALFDDEGWTTWPRPPTRIRSSCRTRRTVSSSGTCRATARRARAATPRSGACLTSPVTCKRSFAPWSPT